jgi:hypothetical protein
MVTPIIFSSIILQKSGMDASFIEFPFDVEEKFGVKGQVKVKAIFDDKVIYRGSLAKMGHHCHILGITKEIRTKLGKTFGDTVEVEIVQDIEKREIIIPYSVAQILKNNSEAKEFFEKLSFTDRKEYMKWIESAKKEQTRQKRLEEFLIKLNNKQKFSDK